MHRNQEGASGVSELGGNRRRGDGATHPVATALAAGVVVVAATTAAMGFVAAASPMSVAAAAGLHALAVVLAASVALRAGLPSDEVRLFALVVAALPGVGAVALWWRCLSGPRHAANAHAANDRLPTAARRRGADLGRELGVDSYSYVVRHGSLEQKRNLLRRLATLGTARHLAVVRQFLAESEPELRLCAHAELARVGRVHEERIAHRREATVGDLAPEAQAAALAELAQANRDYAVSGGLDDEMADYWASRAVTLAREALELAPGCRAAERVLARALADRGEVAAAWEIASSWETECGAASELVRAEIAFRLRRRQDCRESLYRLDAAGVETPVWLRQAAGRGAVDDPPTPKASPETECEVVAT
ncbi:MAG: hypothetical protein NXI31_27010 [bacterium]|nr:hypothetical protein [bacterium]